MTSFFAVLGGSPIKGGGNGAGGRVACFTPGEASGDNDGKDSRVLAEVGVTQEGFRERALTVPDLREEVDSCELLRSSVS